MRHGWSSIAVGSLLVSSSGCAPGILWAHARPEVTAVSLNPCDGHLCGKETGIPFYLPKPLLIVSKNFRNVETPTTGLTDTPPIPGAFDDQSKYADLNARTNFAGLNPGTAAAGGDGGTTPTGPAPAPGRAYKSAPTLHSAGAPVSPGAVPGDGLAPDTFFTYQIVFVPDMTKRYGLKIRGGPGELRAAMNLVNGWQFTGIGPFYMKDSATAQNILSQGIAARLGGQAAADVLNASADLAKVVGVPGGDKQSGVLDANDPRVQRLSETITALPLGLAPMPLVNFAEIHVFEPHLTPDGRMEWCEIVNLNFNRDYLGAKTVTRGPIVVPEKKDGTAGAGLQSGLLEAAGGQGAGLPAAANHSDAVVQSALGAVFGVPANSPAFTAGTGGGLQSGTLSGPGGVPTGGVNQIQVDCGGKGGCRPAREFNLFNFGGLCKERPRAQIHNRTVSGGTKLVPGLTNLPPADNKQPITPGGGGQIGQGLQSGVIPGAIVNQPIFHHPGCPPVAPVPAIPPAK